MNEKETNDLQQRIEDLQAVQIADLERSDELGSAFSFAECSSQIQYVINQFQKLDTAKFKDFPNKHLQTINQVAAEFQTHISNFENFDPTAPDPHNRRNKLIAAFNKFSKNVFDRLTEPLNWQYSLEGLYKDNLEEEKKSLREKEKLISATLERLKKTEEEFDVITGKLQSQAAESGITQEATHFSTEANNHKTRAGHSLSAVVGLSFLIIVYAVVSIVLLEPPKEVAAVINFVANKLMIFGVLVYLLSMSSKSFLSNKHNQTVNTHRKNALLTYETISAGASSDEVKDKILEAASACIYAHQDTGYIKQSQPAQINSLVELMPKTIVDAKVE